MGDKNGTCEKCGKQLFIGIGHSEDSCREARLLRDYETLALAYDKLKEENDAALLQNSELQKEVERCKEIAERDGIDYSDAMLLVSELKTALENSRALVEANRLAIEMLEQEGIRVDGERDNLLRLINEVAELAEHYTGSFWLEETNVAAKKILDVLRPEVKRKCAKCQDTGAYLERDPRPGEDDPMPRQCECREGTYACPHCGEETPHTHTETEIKHAKLFGKLVRCQKCGQFDPPNRHPCIKSKPWMGTPE